MNVIFIESDTFLRLDFRTCYLLVEISSTVKTETIQNKIQLEGCEDWTSVYFIVNDYSILFSISFFEENIIHDTRSESYK